MIHILYTICHKERAEALAALTPGATHGLIDPLQASKQAPVNPAKPLRFKDVETLVFWGHGDQFGFCGLKPPEIVKLVKKWKETNPKIKTIELLTCNARHCTGGDPLANAVKTGLRASFFSASHSLKVKALPVAVGGSVNAFSILLAEPVHKSWAYITAPGTDDKLMQKVNVMMTHDHTDKGSVDYKGSLIDRAQKVIVENPVRNWTINYGHFAGLRNSLVVV